MRALLFLNLIFCFTAAAQNVGIGTTVPAARLHVADSNVLFSAAGVTPASQGNAPASGNGRRMMWYADKAAFRAGYASGDSWDKINVGDYSFATGYGSIAAGDFSVSLGLNSRSTSFSSISLGNNTQANNEYTTAIGTTSFATNTGSTAIGFQAVSQGMYGTAMGYNTLSKSLGGMVVGMYNDVNDSPNPNDTSSQDRIFQVGNGYYDINADEEVRKNALTVLRSGNTGIGTVTPAPSAILELNATNKGFLPPRMTLAQRNAIAAPAEGLMLYQTDAAKGYYYIKNGAWTALAEAPAYNSVNICGQEWMAKNLDVSTYRNGDPIPCVTDPAVWATLTTGAWCYLLNDPTWSAGCLGKLYNWYAVNDSRGLAPAGWHIPTSTEWTNLTTCLGGLGVAGGAMKVMYTFHWTSPNTGATNSSGFAALPGGLRSDAGVFSTPGNSAVWWLPNQINTTQASSATIVYNSSSVGGGALAKTYGLSVRCIKGD